MRESPDSLFNHTVPMMTTERVLFRVDAAAPLNAFEMRTIRTVPSAAMACPV